MTIKSIFCFFFKETTTPEYELEYSDNTFAAETEQEVDSFTLTGEDPVVPAATYHTDPHLLRSLKTLLLFQRVLIIRCQTTGKMCQNPDLVQSQQRGNTPHLILHRRLKRDVPDIPRNSNRR